MPIAFHKGGSSFIEARGNIKAMRNPITVLLTSLLHCIICNAYPLNKKSNQQKKGTKETCLPVLGPARRG